MVKLSKPMPMVRSSSGHFLPWSRRAIVNSLLRETKLAEKFFDVKPMSREEAEAIALEVERKIRRMDLKFVSGPLIREIVNNILLEKGSVNPLYRIYRNIYTRVGAPVFDAYEMDVGRGFEAKENANLQPNAESLPPDELVVIDVGCGFRLTPIGEVVDRLIEKNPDKVVSNGRSEFLKIDEDLYVVSFDENLKVRPQRVTAVVRHKGKEIFEVRLENGRKVRVTKDHNFFTIRDGEIVPSSLSELKVGSYVAVPKAIRRRTIIHEINIVERLLDTCDDEELKLFYIRSEKVPKWLNRGDLWLVFKRYGNRLIKGIPFTRRDWAKRVSLWKYRKTMPLIVFKHLNIPLKEVDERDEVGTWRTKKGYGVPAVLKLSREFGLILGLLISEGWLGSAAAAKSLRGGFLETKVSVSNADEGALLKLSKAWVKVFNRRPRLQEGGGVKRLVLGTKSLTHLLEKGLEIQIAKSRFKTLPSWLYKAPEDCIAGFLEGIYLGDGDLNKGSISSTSRTLIQQIALLMLCLGIYPRMYSEKGGYEHVLYIRGVSLLKLKKLTGLPFKLTAPIEYGDVIPGIESLLVKLKRSLRWDGWCYEAQKCSAMLSRWLSGVKPTRSALKNLVSMIEGGAEQYNKTILERLKTIVDSDLRFERIVEIRQVETPPYTYDFEVRPEDRDLENFVGGLGYVCLHNTTHKKKADKMSKEEYLLLMPLHLADAHLRGDIHIHDLEYFGTRPFCQDWDLRYFFYYGFMPDGMGVRTSVARAAQRPEVAVLHSVKILAAAQTNFAGGEGFYNYLVFLAPYMRGLNYKQVKQLMQMMFYELTQMYIARGGQPVFSNIQITPGVPELWRDVPIVARGKIGPDKYGDYEDEVRMLYRAVNEVALEGDYWGKPFNFPKLENGITPDMFNPEYDEEWLLAHKVVARFGSPYFDNMMPEYRGYGKGVSCYQCLPGDELVVVRRAGSIKVLEISEVKPGDEVLSCSLNSFRVGFSAPEFVLIKPYDGYLYTIQLEGGRRVRVTEDHPIPLLRGRRFITVPASKVKPGDRVPIVLKFPRETVSELRVNGGILSTRARYRLPERIPVTRELAELLGLYLAEGDARRVPRGGVVRFSFGKHERGLAERVKRILEEVFNVKAHIYVFRTALVVQAGSIQLYKLLTEQLKAGHRSTDKDVPDIVFQFPEEAIWAFLKAVFKGDGGLSVGRNQFGYETRSLQLRLASRRACQKVALLSGLVGLPLNYYEHRYGEGDRRIYVCRLTSRRAIEHFMTERPLLEASEALLRVRKVIRERFSGEVYDPVDVEGNHFINGLGIVIHNCCAYSFVETPDSDPEFEDKLYFVDGKHFSMGSWQVVTVNLPRAAYRANGEDDVLFEEARRLMNLCIEVFKTKHRWMRLMLENRRIPFATQRPRDPVTGESGPSPVDFEGLVWTIGLVGANEMAQYHTGYQLHESDEAVRLVVRLLLEMRSYLRELEEKHGLKLALARTPAESCAQRLAICDLIDPEFRDRAESLVKGDLEAAKKLISLGDRDAPVYYSNGTHVNVGAKIPLLEKIRIEGKFFPVLSGGNMLHIWLGEVDPDPEALYKFTKRIAAQTQIGYYAYTLDLTICEDCNKVSRGVNAYCPMCGSINVRWWSRVTGYYQDVKGWNRAKKYEFFERYRVRLP